MQLWSGTGHLLTRRSDISEITRVSISRDPFDLDLDLDLDLEHNLDGDIHGDHRVTVW